MTDIVNATPSRIQLIGINGQTQYFFNFTIFDPTELSVWDVPSDTVGNEVANLLVYLVDYTVTITDSTGGYITLLTPSQGGETITIQGDAPGQRASNFGNNYNFTADNVNQEFNNMVLIYKQVNTLQMLNNLRYDYSQYIPPTKFQFPNLMPGYYPVGSSDGNFISQAPAPGQDDASAAQLRADLAAASGDTLIGTATGYSTVHGNLVGLNVRAPFYGIDTSGTVNLITVAYSPAPTAYNTGELLEILVANSNSTSDVTINKNSLGTKNVVRADGTPLQEGDITDAIQQFIYDGTNYRLLNSSVSQGAWPPMFINGGYCNVNIIDPDNDIDFNQVTCRDFGNNSNLSLTNTITKALDAVWAEGNGQGGFPSSEVLNPGDTVHMFIIAKANGALDAGFDKNLDASGLLTDAGGAGYIYYRRLESGMVDSSSHWRPFQRQGNYIYWLDDITIYNINPSNSGTPQEIVLPVPTIFCTALVYAECTPNSPGNAGLIIYPTSAAQPEAGDYDQSFFNNNGGNRWNNSGFAILTDNTGSINMVNYGGNPGSGTSVLTVSAWIDNRDTF